jgi:hypothetical protein
MAIGGAFRNSSRLRRLAASLGIAALLAQTGPSLLAMPQYIAGAPGDGLQVGIAMPDCPERGVPKDIPNHGKPCAICLALQISSAYVATPPWTLVRDTPADATAVGVVEIRLVDALTFTRPQPRAPPASSTV